MGQKEMANLKSGWETFDHIADIGIRGIGTTLEEAFENGARALFSLMVADLSLVRPVHKKEVNCSSYDLTGLFVAWINSLIALADIEQMLFSSFSVTINDHTLSGLAQGERWTRAVHQLGIEVKGATFTEAKVEFQDGVWIAQCVVDV